MPVRIGVKNESPTPVAARMTRRLGRLSTPKLTVILIAALIEACLIAQPIRSAEAQAASDWSKSELVFESSGYTSIPLIAADSAGDVHLVFMNVNQASREVTATTQGRLMYARLHDGKWSTPTDVVVPSEGGPVNLPSMALDDQGYLHVVFQGGATQQIYYSRAHVSDAGTARGWSRPQPLSDAGASASNISASSDGMVHFVSAAKDGSVHYLRSSDGGHTWTNDVTIVGPSDAAGPRTHADYPRVLSDSQGRVHVTWSEYLLPDGWPSVGAFYSQSLDGGTTWSKPLRVGPQDYGFVSMVSSEPGVIDRVWLSTGDIGERRHQRSTDGGQTWTPSERINDPSTMYSGFTGFPGLAIDSAGILHVVTTLVHRQGTLPGIYELTYTGKMWTEPAYVSTGVGSGSTAMTPLSIEHSQVTITGGNRLHVIYEENFGRIWYNTRLLDTPKVPTAPVLSPLSAPRSESIAPTPQPVQVPTAGTQPARGPAPENQSISEPPGADPVQMLLLSFVPSLILVFGVAAWRMRRLTGREGRRD